MSEPPPVALARNTSASAALRAAGLGVVAGTALIYGASLWQGASGARGPGGHLPPAATSSEPRPPALDAGGTAARPAAEVAISWEPSDVIDVSAAAAEAATWWATWPEVGATATDLTTAAAARARRAELRRLLPRWPAPVVAEVVQRLAGRLALERGDAAYWTMRAAFDVWVERDPVAAARWAGALSAGDGPADGQRDELRRLAGHAWARRDLTGALAWAQTLPDADNRWGMAADIMGRLADREPARAQALLATLLPATARAAEARVFDGWVKQDPVAALETLGRSRLAAGAQLSELSDALGPWIERDPAAAMGWLAALPERPTKEIAELVQIWGRIGPERPDGIDRGRLATALTHWPDHAERVEWLTNALFAWSGDKQGPHGAIEWLRSFDDVALRQEVLQALSGWSYDNREDISLGFAELLPPGRSRDGEVAGLARRWAERDPKAALAWLATRDEPVATRAVQAALLKTLARDDPAAALAQWSALPDDVQRRQAAYQLSLGWVERDPRAAADWRLRTLGDTAPAGDPGFSFEHTWTVFMSRWVRQDAAAALAWADSNQDPALRRDFVASWAHGLDYATQGSAAPAALNWPARTALLAQVSDAEQRTTLLSRHVANWLAADRAAAKTWLESTDLLPAEKAAQLLHEAGATDAPPDAR